MAQSASHTPLKKIVIPKRRWVSGKTALWAGLCGVGVYAADYFINSNVVLQYAQTPFNEKIIQNCSELQKKKFYPTWYLSPSLFQAVYGAVFDHHLTFEYKREILKFEDGGDAALDWGPIRPECDKEDQKILFVLHGLSGGADCIYMKQAVDAGRQNGFRTVAFSFRGLTNNPIKTPEFHDLTDLSDIVIAIKHIKQKYPNAPIYGLGISFGGNLLLKYAGDQKDECLFNSIVTVANPFNLSTCAEMIHKPKRFIYHNRLLSSFLAIIRENEHMLRKNPKINVDEILASKTIREYDERFSIKLNGYTLEEYYAKAGCENYVKDVKIPMLCVNSLDDPISEKYVIPWKKLHDNPNFIMLATQKGGHVDFFINHNPVRWVNIAAMQYLNFIDKELKETKLKAGVAV